MAPPECLFSVLQLTQYSMKALAYLLARRLAILSNSYAALPILPQKIVFGTILKPTANRGIFYLAETLGIEPKLDYSRIP